MGKQKKGIIELPRCIDKYTREVYAVEAKAIVRIEDRARKQLKKVPFYVAVKLKGWVHLVECHGLAHARSIRGYRDKPLKGKRKGQRSIRLSIGYRAFYTTNKDGEVELVNVCEVNKHEY